MAATLPDINTLIQAGINPKTGLPSKLGSCACNLKGDIKKTLRILDEQDAIHRYKWYNLPNGLTGPLIERILYYKGQGILFYMEADSKFYFLPYALDGTIDVYGRYMGVTPLPFAGGTTTKDGKEKPWITGLTKKPYYDIVMPNELSADTFKDGCVILKDYSEQLNSGSIIPRAVLQDAILDVMSDCIPFMRTSLLASTGIDGVRVNSEEESQNVTYASRAVNDAALKGDIWTPIIGNVDFQTLTGNNAANASEYLLALQSLDNYRLSLYGLDNGGLFQKQSHMLQAEHRMNSVNSGLVMEDGLFNRQQFAAIVNSIWGTGTWVEPNEVLTNIDTDGDGNIGGNSFTYNNEETVNETDDGGVEE